jgi:hypothetical protein
MARTRMEERVSAIGRDARDRKQRQSSGFCRDDGPKELHSRLGRCGAFRGTPLGWQVLLPGRGRYRCLT